ncbi:MAG: Sporulation protein YpeB [Firmicutes bacterium ADurb.Bin182]|nr:MAG: Sporulation protein YpeB [Firmicutes bacterium ADurb.Bin182]
MSEKTQRIITAYIIPSVLVAALIIACVWGYQRSAEATAYKNAAEAMYQRAYQELATSLSNMEVTLGKLMVVNSPAQYVFMLDDLWRTSGTAVGLMSQLPASHVDNMELNAFLVRLGDYAQSLTKKVMQGRPILDEDLSQLEQLHNACAELSVKMQQKIDNGEFSLALIDTDGFFADNTPTESEGTAGPAETAGGNEGGSEPEERLEGEKGNASGKQTEESEDETEGSEGSGETSQEGQQKYPVLIYDGPFAESVDKLQPKGLTGREVSSEEALAVAQSIAGNAQLAFDGESPGSIPSYDFSGTYEDGRFFEASVTKTGGKILWFMSSATGGAEGVPEEREARGYKDTAGEFLKKMGFDAMQSTYAQYYNGICLINFAAVQDNVILYSDLVKVWVDRETGEVVGLDARNYWFSHTKRDLPESAITEQEAKDMLSANLEVKDVNMALIPVTPQTEKLCYEFKGTFGGDSYIVYVNALSGDEEQVYRIIDSDEGQLVI